MTKLLTPQEVGKEHLNCSRATVDRLIASGRHRAVKLHQGQRKATYRVRTEDLERFITENLTTQADVMRKSCSKHVLGKEGNEGGKQTLDQTQIPKNENRRSNF